MKKIFEFYFDEQTYILKENKKEGSKFIISKDTLEFNGNQFYQNIFKDYSYEDEIEIKNKMKDEDMEKDKFARYILDMLKEMISNIEKKIDEEKAK